MKLHYLFLLITLGAEAGNVEVEGEITINLIDPSNAEQYKTRVKDQESVNKLGDIETGLISEEDRVVRGYENGKMTVGPVVECMYQIPEEAQVQALLSNMMNELTKMFMRAHEMMNDDFRRKGETRFRVVSKKQNYFFDGIYNNMTEQYLSLYNSTAVRVDRSERKKGPCENQEEIKELWRDLLESSLTTFRQAASRCIDEHLKAKGELKDSKIRRKLDQYLLKELSKIKMTQLALLCDKFQLCYNELIRRNQESHRF